MSYKLLYCDLHYLQPASNSDIVDIRADKNNGYCNDSAVNCCK